VKPACLCSRQCCTISIFDEENIPAQAEANGRYLMVALEKIGSPNIREIRGLGLMIGIEMKQKVAPFLNMLRKGESLP
jgi:acetylornithine/LysW-gamma-L-lysine aminotransferase